MGAQTRTSHSVRNISTGLISQATVMILGFVNRTVFVNYLAVEYLGVNSLFSNILSMLALAELGIGSAFMYSLYKPLAEKNEQEIATILNYFKKVYTFIGLFIFLSGLCLIPFLDNIIAHKPPGIHEDIRFIYLIFLFNSASTYFFSYKILMLQADQQSAVVTINSTIFLIFQHLLQIVVLVLTANFILFLLVQVISNLLSNFYISKLVDKKHPFLALYRKNPIDKAVKEKIISNTKATFLTKIGGALVNGTDNLIINYFVGLALLGKFSNYAMLVAMVTNVLVIVFANIRSSVAHVTVTESKEKQIEMFRAINFANFWVYGFCAIMIIFLINDFVALWLGPEYLLSTAVVVMLAVNFFMAGMQNAFWTFKSVYGFFRQGRYMVLATAALNVVFSIALGYYYGIFGILLATAIARLVTNFWYDPHIVLTRGLQISPLAYLKQFGKYILILSGSIAVIYVVFAQVSFSSLWISMIVKGLVCLIVPNIAIIFIFRHSEEFRKVVQLFQSAIGVIRKKSI